MTKWSTETAATRKTAAVDVSSNVSSFAIIVDLTTKAKLLEPVYCGTSVAAGVSQNNSGSDYLQTCTVGAIGNQIGFWIQNGTTTTTTLKGF
jgi:hypothetical protein